MARRWQYIQSRLAGGNSCIIIITIIRHRHRMFREVDEAGVGGDMKLGIDAGRQGITLTLIFSSILSVTKGLFIYTYT